MKRYGSLLTGLLSLAVSTAIPVDNPCSSSTSEDIQACYAPWGGLAAADVTLVNPDENNMVGLEQKISVELPCQDATAVSRGAVDGAVPEILRRGLGHEAGPGQGARLERVGLHRPHASDHAALVLDLPGL